MATEKRTSLKKVNSEKMAAGIYAAEFNDGTTFEANLRELPDGNGGTLGATYDGLPPMVQRTLQYGIKQKLDDSMAGAETVEDAVLEVRSTWAAIVAGNWTIRVAGEGVEGGLFARAYAEFHNIPLADAKAKISAMVDANLKANRDAISDPKKKEELTERMVFNAIRAAAMERYPELAKVYEGLKEKRKTKQKAGSTIKVDLSDE